MRRAFVTKALLACLLSVAAMAQEITGDIRGIVTDPSGAVVSGASVVVTNTDRNTVIRDLKTGTDGAYSATYLPVGRYKVTVTAPGFATYNASDVVVNVNDRRTLDVKLKVGAVGDTVEVRDAPAQVELQSAAATGLITGTQVRELPLTSRNYLNLVTLQPGVSNFSASDQSFVGVTNPSGLSAQVNLAVNGNRPTQNNWTIDGADNVDRGANLTLLAFPSLDSIAEFKVLRSSYLPEQGRSSGGVITLITRGGTEQFHGSAYEFWRNDKLNANNYFNNQSAIARPELRWNDFGFTLGGPIFRKKTFFFYSQEWRRIITYSTNTSGELPTQKEQAGDFSETGNVCIQYDPDTGDCIPGTQIGAINPVAQAYVNDIYSKLQPPNSIDNTLTWVGRNVFNYREENIRIDHNFTTNFSVFGRYLDDSIPTQEPAGLFTGLGVPLVANTTTQAPGRNLAVHATWAVSPSAVADMGFAYSYGAVVSDPTGLIATKNSPNVNPTLPFPGAPRVPDINFNDGQGLTGFGPYRDYNRNYNVFASFAKTYANHALKFGGSFNYYTKDENVNGFGGVNGAFSMSDTSNNEDGPADGTFQQEWANFLLGKVANFTQTSLDFRALVHQKQFEIYGQDEWRARPNLTINYGFRYSLFLAPTYGNGLLTTFDPSKFNAADVPAIDSDGLYAVAPTTPYVNGIIRGGNGSPYGGAVQKTSKADFAPRLGIVWNPRGDGKTAIRSGFGLFYDSPSVGTVENFIPTNPPVVSFTSISNTSLSDPASGIADVNRSPATIGGVGPNWKQPYTMMWSLDIQHQLTPTMVFDIGYYGNAGRHLIGILDVNMPQPGAFLSVGIPGPVSLGNTQKLNQVRPFKGWDAINQFETVFNSNYNGLQAQLQKQFTSNSQIVVNYTWSHALGTASSDFRSPQNTYNIPEDYGSLDFDRRHIFSASYVYTLPWYKTQQGLVGHVLGGWEFNGIIYANTGSHLTVTASRDPAGLGVRGNSNSSGRPDLVGDPQQGAPHTIAQWFNKSAFALVPTGEVRPGNEPRGTVVGPGYFRWDAALFKNNRLSERFSLQFRAESQNVLNHTNFNNPSTSFTSSLFGRILTARDPRNLQLALKLVF